LHLIFGFLLFIQEEGKEPMSIPLLKLICKWSLLDCETNDGTFVHCFLLTTWNRGCLVNNTTIIKFRDISWAHSFDCFQVFLLTPRLIRLAMNLIIPDIFLEIRPNHLSARYFLLHRILQVVSTVLLTKTIFCFRVTIRRCVLP
jgi:hypothetical protein